MRIHEEDPGLVAEEHRRDAAEHEHPGKALDAMIAGVPQAAGTPGVLALQRAAGNATVAQLLEDETAERSPVMDVVGKGGEPLDDSVRSPMEKHLGADLSDVRIHNDAQASESAQAVGAHAYTVGNDIAFRSGSYSPGTADGQRMLAHELTHVVQQRSGPVDGTPQAGGVKVSDPSDRFEQAAESSADDYMSAQTSVQRDEVPEEEEEEPVQSFVQRQEAPEEEEEPVQSFVQRQDVEDEALEDDAEPQA